MTKPQRCTLRLFYAQLTSVRPEPAISDDPTDAYLVTVALTEIAV